MLPPAPVPAVLTAAGTLTAFGTAFAAHALYGMIGPALAFILLGAIALALLLAVGFGHWLLRPLAQLEAAIGRMGATYSQNAKTLEEYCDALDQGHLPVVRGLTLSRDDMVRRAVIMALMCQGELQFESINLAWLIDFTSYFAREMQALTELQAQGLVEQCPELHVA